MPFTPYHLGPPFLIFGIFYLLRKNEIMKPINITWLGGLAIGSVISDLQGFYSVFFDSRVSLHGFSHTIAGTFVYSFLGVIILWIGMMINNSNLRWFDGYLSNFIGILLFHIIPDMFIWSDMNILWPIGEFSPGTESNYDSITQILGLTFLLGLIFFLGRNLFDVIELKVFK